MLYSLAARVADARSTTLPPIAMALHQAGGIWVQLGEFLGRGISVLLFLLVASVAVWILYITVWHLAIVVGGPLSALVAKFSLTINRDAKPGRRCETDTSSETSDSVCSEVSGKGFDGGANRHGNRGDSADGP